MLRSRSKFFGDKLSASYLLTGFCELCYR